MVYPSSREQRELSLTTFSNRPMPDPKAWANHKDPPTMRGYDTYRFRDKDPAIDLLRTVVQVQAAAHGISFNAMLWKIAKGIGRKSPSMLWAWFSGPTHAPNHAGVQAVARFLGKEFRMMDLSDSKVVPFRKKATTTLRRRATGGFAIR